MREKRYCRYRVVRNSCKRGPLKNLLAMGGRGERFTVLPFCSAPIMRCDDDVISVRPSHLNLTTLQKPPLLLLLLQMATQSMTRSTVELTAL